MGTIPVNPETVTQIVSKTMLSDQELAALGWDRMLIAKGQKSTKELPEAKIVPFTSWAEVEKCIERKLGGVNFDTMARNAIERAFGKV